MQIDAPSVTSVTNPVCDDEVVNKSLDQNAEDKRNTAEEVIETVTLAHAIEEQLGQGHREGRPSEKLKDYICHTMCRLDPSHASPAPTSSKSLGTRYPILNYVTCANFSKNHKHFIVAVNAGKLPSTVFKALRDLKWRATIKEEIDAL